MPDQTIVRVAGLRGEYTLKSVARNGDVTVFGPVTRLYAPLIHVRREGEEW
jgi:hypothetical protein